VDGSTVLTRHAAALAGVALVNVSTVWVCGPRFGSTTDLPSRVVPVTDETSLQDFAVAVAGLDATGGFGVRLITVTRSTGLLHG